MNSNLMGELLFLPQATLETWNEREFSAVLTHLLESSVRESFALLDPIHLQQSEAANGAEYPSAACFGQLLENDPVPSLSVIRLVKNIANICLEQPEIGVPEPIAEVLYYLAIASGFLNHGSWITSLSPAAVQTGLSQIAPRRWLDERIRLLLARCQTRLADIEG